VAVELLVDRVGLVVELDRLGLGLRLCGLRDPEGERQVEVEPLDDRVEGVAVAAASRLAVVVGRAVVAVSHGRPRP
jgi:hypothetical protein